MGDRRCCCDCEEYEDNFNRADNDDLGDDWTEVSGDWSIASSELSEAGASAIAIYDKAMPTQWMKARITIVDEQCGDVYKLYVSWKDANNHVYGMYELLCTTSYPAPGYNYRISLHSVSGGVDTEIDSLEEYFQEWPKDHRQFSVCNSTKIAMVSLDDSSLCTIYADGIDVGSEAKYSGVGHENTHTSTFDDWYVGEVSYTKKDKDGNLLCPCSGANCICDEYVLGHELHGVYEGEGDCDNLDGISFTMSRVRCGADAAAGMFRATQVGTCLEGTRYEIYCASGSPVEDWELHISEGDSIHGCGYVGDAYLSPEPGSTCDPLYLVYCIDSENIGVDNCGDCNEVLHPCGQAGGAGCIDPADPAFPCPRTTYCIIITE